MTTQDAHSLVGAYALDALTELERRQFEAHLTECESCSQEVRGLRETAARLGAAAASTPPPQLRGRVLAEVARVRQSPPLVRPARLGHRLPRRLLTVAAVACLVLALALGTVLVRTRGDLHRAQALNRQVTAVLSAPDAQSVSAPVVSGGTGTVVVSRSRGQAVVAMYGLGPLPASRTYELWLMGGRPPVPVGLMRTAVQPVVTGLGEATTQIGITVEPAGGSAQPTGAPIFAVRLPA